VSTLFANRVGGGNDGVVELLQGGSATFDGRCARRSQYPQGFHLTVSVFGYLNPLARQSGLGGGDGVERVVFALGTTQ
jgi:hypothetical protein